MSALGLAAWNGNTEMVQMLVQAGADVNYQLSTVSVGVVRILQACRQLGAVEQDSGMDISSSLSSHDAGLHSNIFDVVTRPR
jgi:hypothetical protein